MQQIDGQGNVAGTGFDFFNSRWLLRSAVAAAAAAAFMTGATSHAAMITPITSADVPISGPSSFMDVSNPGNQYSLGSGTKFIPAGFDTRDLFGGSFGTFGPEQHDVIFDNYQPIGTIATVNVTLSSPISPTGFSLYLEDDGPGGERSASEFKLFGDGQLIDDVPILDNTGLQSYTSVYGSNYIELTDQFSGASGYTNYTLEFVQNRDAGNSSGVRALEFQATGVPPTTVPEPASLAVVITGGIAVLCRRKRRTGDQS